MQFKLPGRDNNEYFIVVVYVSLSAPLTIRFDIDSWVKYTTGKLSEPECKWNTDDGNGYHHSTMCCRYYRDGEMEWFSDDGKERPGLPLSVVNGVEKFCDRILKLKAFL